MKIEHNGVEIELEFDEDGFPIITIELNGYTAENDRPAVDVILNGVVIHEMFDNDQEDLRWNS